MSRRADSSRLTTGRTAVRTHPAGLTLVEMNVGMLVMALIAGALAAFTLSLGGHWRAGETTQALDHVALVSSYRLTDHLAACRDVLAIHTTAGGGTALVLWASDDVALDGLIQAGEIQVLAYDPAAATIWFHARVADGQPLQADAVAQAQAEVSRQSVTEPAFLPTFLQSGFLAPGRAFVGPGGATSRSLAQVTATTWSVRTQGQGRPVATFDVMLTRDGEQANAFGSAALRCWEGS